MPTASFLQVDPALSRATDGLMRPSSGSPAIGAALLSSGLGITADMDGQLRTGSLDVGADQSGSAAASRRPLTSADVGPQAP